MNINLGDNFLTYSSPLLTHQLNFLTAMWPEQAAPKAHIITVVCSIIAETLLHLNASVRGSTYQNCVTVRTHSGAKPLVGLEINLVFSVIEQDKSIPWGGKNTEKTMLS